MPTARDKEQSFARLFRMLDSSLEAEALSAFCQARRMLQEERATFGAILDHTQHLNETNAALGEQNRDLSLENEKYRSRVHGRGFKRAALARFGQLTTWPPFADAKPLDHAQSGEGIAGPRPGFRLSWRSIPRDLRTLLGIFALVAATTVASNNGADSRRSTSPGHGWLARLPVNFSVDHPPWCPACRRQPAQPNTDHQRHYGRMF